MTVDNLPPYRRSSNRFFLGLALFVGILLIVSFIPHLTKSTKKITSEKQLAQNVKEKKQMQQAVLGERTPPTIYVSGGREGYTGGGMVALASTDEPSVTIGGYNITGQVEVSLYEANEDALFTYLLHSKKGKQLQKTADASKFRLIKTLKHEITSSSGEGKKLLLPLEESGIYFLRIKKGSTSEDSFIVRSKTGALVKEGDNEYVFWAQDYASGRSISEGSVSLYNTQDSVKQLNTTQFAPDGLARVSLTSDADFAVVRRGNPTDVAVIPINLRYLGYENSKTFTSKEKVNKYFLFTDRPLYRPGDKMYFKSILRDDDDARYSIPSGVATVTLSDGYSSDTPLYQANVPISSDGTIAGEYSFAENAKTGFYTLKVEIPGSTTSTYTYFSVEYFRKPEYYIDVTSSQSEVISGDALSFTIQGNYFSGQPISARKVKYNVYTGDYWQYEYVAEKAAEISDDYRYGYWGGEIIAQGERTFDKNGKVTIPLKTQVTKGKNQVYSIEAQFDDGSGNPSFSRKNVIVYAGEYDIFRKDYSFYTSNLNEPKSLPLIVDSHRNQNVGNIRLSANVKRENWIPYTVPNQKYPSYRHEEETLPTLNATTDAQGNATFTFTPTKVGLYTLHVEGKDSKGNMISKDFTSYVSSYDYPYYSGESNNDLTITSDKPSYLPSENAQLTLTSTTPDRDIFLSFERGRMDRYQIVHMTGKSARVEVPLIGSDIPNMYASVSSFSKQTLDRNSVNIVVSPTSKKLKVSISPDRKSYAPGDQVVVNVSTTDVAGNPYPADVALWTVDKALYELASANTGDIFDTFWAERYDGTESAHSLEGITAISAERGGGCFAKGTLILMADGTQKPIEQIQKGEWILTRSSDKQGSLVKAQVLLTHNATVSGYLSINGTLNVTTNHKVFINGNWHEAGDIQIGDTLLGKDGKEITVSSVEWIKGNFTVYNLGVEKYHTYFANGMYVHNDKGDTRSVFKDTAYWNPSIKTDSSGRAQVSFTLPDNLTTWVLAGVANTTDTKVGQATGELLVTKDVIVRPILPNILRVGDSVRLSALVQNFTPTQDIFDVLFSFPSAKVTGDKQDNITIASNETKELFFTANPQKAEQQASVIYSAKSKKNKDAVDVVEQKIPIREFGFSQVRAQTRNGSTTYPVLLANDINKGESRISLSLSPSILGTLPIAMNYLVGYPYGCVEQTTSRFVPAVIALANRDIFADTLSDKDLPDMINDGVARLAKHQTNQGGWAWWSSGEAKPFITAYVVEYLLEAKKQGIDVDPYMLSRAQEFLESDTYYDPVKRHDTTFSKEDIVAKTYALTLLNSPKRRTRLSDLSGLSAEFLSMAVMANYKNGDTNPKTNGLALLEKMAIAQGDGVYWPEGKSENFGSIDASTAFAIRAIVTAQGNRDLAVKGAQYFTRHRKTNYWSNTFATAQVIRAIVDLAKSGSEQSPNYSYKVSLGNTVLATGSVTNSRQIIKDISLPVSSFVGKEENVEVTQQGQGQMYSTLIIDEFHTDRNAKAEGNGLSIKREYVNEKGYEYGLGVGDLVTVKLTVSGLSSSENYGVISDELPSGMIPINESLNNQQYQQDPYEYYYNSYDVTDKEVTENGVVLSLYQIPSGERTYTYKARVVSEGTFLVPPAKASLMYAPEISAHSAAETVTISREAKVIPKRVAKKTAQSLVKGSTVTYVIALAIAVLLLTIVFMAKKGITLTHLLEKMRNKRQDPPPSAPQSSSPFSPQGGDIPQEEK